jgi:hypothetical protein
LPLPPLLLIAQRRPFAHCDAAEQMLPEAPLVHTPWLALTELLPQWPLLHSASLLHGESFAPSPQLPSESLDDASRTQIMLSQSVLAKHAAPREPSLQVPTNEVAGSRHCTPALQSLVSLHFDPDVPAWHSRAPDDDTATQLPALQSPSSRHAAPGIPVVQSPDVAPVCKHRPPLQSASLAHGAKLAAQSTTSPRSRSHATAQSSPVRQPRSG